MLLYSYTFTYRGHTGFLSCCAFCGPTIYAIYLLLLFSLSTSMFEHFHLWCLTFQHLKHFTSSSSTISCLLTFTSSLTLYCITLFAITSNLFQRISFPFISFLFLQLQTRCPNLLQYQHILLLLPSNFTLSLVKVYCWLSMLLMRELYCSRDMVLHL